MYSYESEEMPLWSAGEMFAMGLISEEELVEINEPWESEELPEAA